jgi:hypothetical protein
VLLKRYGHFGKVPTSAALMARESGGDLPELRTRVFSVPTDPLLRARTLLSEISRAWRVSEKIGSMLLSLTYVPGISAAPPWREGVDWTFFVVVDSNVDLFLKALGYKGLKTYDARREFVRTLAREVDISDDLPDAPAYNPRLVQQAMYLFMSPRPQSPERSCRSSSVLCPGARASRRPCLEWSAETTRTWRSRKSRTTG